MKETTRVSMLPVFLLLLIGGLAAVWALASYSPGTDSSGVSLLALLHVESPPGHVTQHTNEQPTCDFDDENGWVGHCRALNGGGSVHLVNNPDAKNVSFAELKSFILEDNTNQLRYLDGMRKCTDFAEALHNNAEAAGIRAAYVAVSFEGGGNGHALSAFQTTDEGLLYVDCTGPVGQDFPHSDQFDRIVRLEEGKTYKSLEITYYPKVACDAFWHQGVVEKVEIYW